jgi:heme oxygenase
MRLSESLREHTRVAHRDAERTGIVRAMLDGTIVLPQYQLWLRNLHEVYVALEVAMIAQPAGTPAAVFADPLLYRAGAIESDLVAMLGASWTTLPILPAAGAYRDHVRSLGLASGPGLLGHGYVRYLGDLSGGQLLRGLLRDRLGLPPAALSYYEFPGIEDVPATRNALRERMDLCPLSSDAVSVVLDEALAGFRLTMNLARDASLAQAG